VNFDEFITNAQDALTVRKVFGEPFEKDGTTVIPAAKVMGGGGGGSGTDEEGQAGEGGGFGMHARPAGAFVIRDGEVAWRPAVDSNIVIAAATAVVISAIVSGVILRLRSRS
jgi:uncharacterized spore protein YtfJ